MTKFERVLWKFAIGNSRANFWFKTRIFRRKDIHKRTSKSCLKTHNFKAKTSWNLIRKIKVKKIVLRENQSKIGHKKSQLKEPKSELKTNHKRPVCTDQWDQTHTILFYLWTTPEHSKCKDTWGRLHVQHVSVFPRHKQLSFQTGLSRPFCKPKQQKFQLLKT